MNTSESHGAKSIPQSWKQTRHLDTTQPYLIWWHLAKPSHVCVEMVTVLSSLLPHLIFLGNQVTRWTVSPGWIKSHIYILYISISLMVHTCSHWHDRSHLTKLKDARSRGCWDSFIYALQVCVRTNHDLLQWIYLPGSLQKSPASTVSGTCMASWHEGSIPNQIHASQTEVEDPINSAWLTWKPFIIHKMAEF